MYMYIPQGWDTCITQVNQFMCPRYHDTTGMRCNQADPWMPPTGEDQVWGRWTVGGGGNLIGDHAVSGGVTSEANPCSLFLIGIIINDKDDKGTLFSEVGVEVVHPVGI